MRRQRCVPVLRPDVTWRVCLNKLRRRAARGAYCLPQVTPLLPAPAQPLVSMAADMETSEFVEMAAGVAESLDTLATSTHADAVANSHAIGVAAPPSPALANCSSTADTVSSPRVAADANGAAAAAAPPAPTAPAAPTATPREFDVGRFAAPLLVAGRSLIRVQIEYLTHAPLSDVRASTLKAGALSFGGSLLGTLGALLTLQPYALLLSGTAAALGAIVMLLEAEGATAAGLSAPILARVPGLRTAAGRTVLCLACGMCGMLGGPLLTTLLGCPLLLATAMNAFAHHSAVPVLARLRAEIPDATAAAAAHFRSADCEGAGTLSGGALSRLCAAILPGDSFMLRGVTVALCPLGGHVVSAASLAKWHADGAAVAAAVGVANRLSEEEEQIEDVPLAQTYYGTRREDPSTGHSGGPDLTEASPLEAAQAVLHAGPPAGGWTTQQASAALALSAAAMLLASVVSALVGVYGVFGKHSSYLFTLLPAIVAAATVAVLAASVDLSQLRAPVGPLARPHALRALRACPPLSVAFLRAVVLLVDGAAIARALPPVGGLASLARLLALIGCLVALVAAVLSFQAAFALLFRFSPRPRPSGAAEAGSVVVPVREEELRSLLADAGCPYLEGCVSLDLDRDGTVSQTDLERFYGSGANT